MLSDRGREGDPRPPELDRQIKALCREFEQAWHAGQSPRITEYLGRVPDDAQAVALGKLVAQELRLRSAKGEPVDIRDYCQRFPDNVSEIRAAFDLTRFKRTCASVKSWRQDMTCRKRRRDTESR